jgi:hypothetical protein
MLVGGGLGGEGGGGGEYVKGNLHDTGENVKRGQVKKNSDCF